MRYRLRTLLIVAMIIPVIGPLRFRQPTSQSSKLKEWSNPDEPQPEAVARPTADDYTNMFKNAQARKRIDDYIRSQETQSKQFQLDPSYPLLYLPQWP